MHRWACTPEIEAQSVTLALQEICDHQETERRLYQSLAEAALRLTGIRAARPD